MAVLEKEHATWSASSTEANVNCPGRLALVKDMPETTSEAADWGTCCHQLAEHCLVTGEDADAFIGRVLKGKKHENEVDDEMADTAQMYVDYVRERLAYAPDGILLVEQRFSLASLNPPFDAGGTADAVIYWPSLRAIEVVDLKGGRGVVVDAIGNMQERTYGLGAVLANPSWKIDTIQTTIVQPRAPHKDGRIRSEILHVADLIEWTQDLRVAMKRSAEALAELPASGQSRAAWSAKWLKAGTHCKFCPAAASCPALKQKTLDTAGVWFDDLDQPQLANKPDDLTPDAIAETLDLADMISDWVNAVRAHAHEQAEKGIEIPRYILVQKQAREKWNDDVESKVAFIAETAGFDGPLHKPSALRTPKQIRDAIAKLKTPAAEKAVERLKGLSATPSGGTNLVAATKTVRKAVTPRVNQFFDLLD